MNIDEYHEIQNKINSVEILKDWAMETYKELRIDNGLSMNDGDYWEGEIIEFYDDSLFTSWEKHWGYGGEDSGTCDIPIAAIIGTEKERYSFIKSLIDAEVSDNKKKEIKKQTNNQNEKLKLYNKLKKEFGEEND